MAIGTRPVTELSKAVFLTIYLDTGAMDSKGNPVINRVRVGSINPNAAREDLYDVAYMYAGLTAKTLAGISIGVDSEVGPID